METVETALVRAVNANDSRTVERLLKDTNADPNMANDEGNTLLHRLARKGHARLCRVLVRGGARVNSSNHAGMTPLFLASGVSLKTVRVLLQSGSDVHLRNGLGEVPLHAASSSGLTDVISELVLSGSDVNVRSWQGQTPLYSAISSRSRNAVKTLLQLGAEVNQSLSLQIPGAVLGHSCCWQASRPSWERSSYERVRVSRKKDQQLRGHQPSGEFAAGDACGIFRVVESQADGFQDYPKHPSHPSGHPSRQLSEHHGRQSNAPHQVLSQTAQLQGWTRDQVDTGQNVPPCSRPPDSTTISLTACPTQQQSDAEGNANMFFEDSEQSSFLHSQQPARAKVIRDSKDTEFYQKPNTLSKVDKGTEQSDLYRQQNLPMHVGDSEHVVHRQHNHRVNREESITSHSAYAQAKPGDRPDLPTTARVLSAETKSNPPLVLSLHPPNPRGSVRWTADHENHSTAGGNTVTSGGSSLCPCTKSLRAGEEHHQGGARTQADRAVNELRERADADNVSAASNTVHAAVVAYSHTSVTANNTSTNPTGPAETLATAESKGDQLQGSTDGHSIIKTKETVDTGFARTTSAEGGEEAQTTADASAGIGDKKVCGFTALHRASQLGLEPVARELLAFGARVNARTSRGETPLHLAAKFSSTLGGGRGQETTGPLIRLLVRAGAELEARSSGRGETPLHQAALVGDALSASVLISEGADVHTRDSLGNTPLHKACERILSPEARRVRTVRVLMAGGARAEEENDDGLTPLHVLLSYRDGDVGGGGGSSSGGGVDADVARVLLGQHSPNRRTAAGQHPLLLSLQNGLTAVSAVLVEKGAEPSVVDPDGRTPMHYACAAGNARLFQMLWTKGGNPEALDKRGFSPLRCAVANGSEAAVRACVNTGAVSVSYRQPPVLRKESPLVSSLNEVLQNFSASHSPFHYAFVNLQLDIMVVLVSSGSFSFAELSELRSACQAVDLDELSECQRSMVEFILHFSQSPPSLQNLCRWRISHLLGCFADRPKYARELRLPSVLRKFVLDLSDS